MASVNGHEEGAGVAVGVGGWGYVGIEVVASEEAAIHGEGTSKRHISARKKGSHDKMRPRRTTSTMRVARCSVVVVVVVVVVKIKRKDLGH